MAERGVVEDELSIDWDHLLENLPDDLNFGFPDQAAGDGLSTSPDSGCSLSIEDIEHLLLNDQSDYPEGKDILADGFFADVLLDLDSLPEADADRAKDSSTSPELDRAKGSSASPESVEVEIEKEQDKDRNGVGVPQAEQNSTGDEDDDGDDPDAKRRKRKLRNRDAAVRSRERKKMYVRDLEMKSKYYEAECKRLGIMLQCCLAENQALRLSFHNNQAFDASKSKQESAVLLLESLLLGSLLGFLGIIYLLILPSHLVSTLEGILRKNMGGKEWGSVAPRKAGNEVFRSLSLSFMLGKRCKASRSRMKLRLPAAGVSPWLLGRGCSLSMVCC